MADVGGIAGDRLRSFVERIERLKEEIKALNSDVSDIYKEAVGEGFDKKALQAIIKRRAMQGDELSEFDHLVDLYERAIDGTDIAINTARVHVREAAE